ncbi:MAG: dihydrolipoyl dehydrogenase [Thermoanaerobaculum sp.]|nr:dihydrolipoyl dehydrogenase [Thermoanaerobaculum sp.]MDW7968701.1 dihydrolipoyl dehydrogenase [Thermoanaerobaculum sp.]
MPEGMWDLVVIGAGPGGYVGAIRAGQLGLKTLVIEKEPVLGGTCLHRGCIPTKALLHTADLLQKAREGESFGVRCQGVELDLAAAHAHKRKVVTKNAKGIESLFKKNGVTWRQGTGKILGPGKVEITAPDGTREEVTGKFVLLATGSRCGDLPHVKADGDRIINSDHALELAEVPARLLVLGAGAVGMEFASIFARFGAKVTVVELLERVLPLEDPDVSKEVERAFRKQGITCHTATRVEAVETGEFGVRLWAHNAAGEEVQLEGDRLLLAVGRQAMVEGVGLEHTQAKVEKGRILVDRFCRAEAPWLYAIGDLIPTPWLAHVASMEGVVAVEHMAGKNPPPINYNQVPSCTYCYPEVASIGLSEPQAREQGYDVRVGRFPFSASGKAAILGESLGFVKIVAEGKYGELLGVHIVGPHATELIAEAEAALRGELTAEELAWTIHAHPTLHEAIHEAAEGVHGMTIHI